MSTLMIVRGLPGSGKGYQAKKHAAEYGWLYYEPDHLITDVLGKYRFDSQIWDAANDFVYRLADFALARKESVIVSDTFLDDGSINRYVELSIAHGAELIILTIEPNLFNSNGELRNIHNLPLTVIEDMQEKFIYDLREFYSPEYYNHISWRFMDGFNEPEGLNPETYNPNNMIDTSNE